ncbi:MAG: InlB B-repeat-containing protein, partial [Bacteroidales bacterium]|nr:InlB B-repeat-containing protein [Bacteroidales bacterium]
VEIIFDANGGSFPLSGGAVAEKTVYVKKGSSITVEDIEALPETYCAEVDAEQQCVSTMYFTGWSYKQSNVTDADILDLNGGTAGEKATNDVTIYAVWTETKTFTVKFLAQDNTTVNFVAYVDQGQHVTTRPDDPSIPGYDFVKWLDENNVEFSFSTEIERSIVLHAEWEVHNYTITYHLNEGETNHPGNPGTYNVNTPTIALDAPEKTGHTFKKWSYNQDCTDPAFEINANLSRDVDLFPCWEVKTYTISYLVGNNAYGTVSDQTKTHDVAFRLEGEGRFTRAGYSQDGWSTDIEGKNIDYPLHASYTENADLTLYPHWVKDLEVVQNGAIKIFRYANGTATAEIDGEYSGTETVEITGEGISVNSVTLSRSFNVNKISTLYVPFEIAATDVRGANVYKFKTVVWNEDDRRWKFKVSTATTVKPNTPYVILPTAAEVTFDITGTVTLNTTTTGEETSNELWNFIGTYSYIDFTLDDNNPVYLFANQERDGAKLGEFVRIATGAFTNPMRAYLVYHKSAAAGMQKSASGNLGNNILLPDELDIEVEDENGIVVEKGRLNTVTGEVRMDRWYDLKGRRLNSKPTAKGTYYKNGKKAIIK